MGADAGADEAAAGAVGSVLAGLIFCCNQVDLTILEGSVKTFAVDGVDAALGPCCKSYIGKSYEIRSCLRM